MSKILNLKRWLTITEAAKHMSLAFEETVTEGDVLYFVLDGQLQLSIDFVNGTPACKGKIVPLDEAPTMPGLFSGEPVICGARLNDGSVMVMDDEVIHLSGIFDIPLIGSDRLDIEFQYQQMIGGPDIDLVGLDGAFVRRGEAYFQLQEDFDNNEFTHGSLAALGAIKAKIASGAVDSDSARKLLEKHAETREAYLIQRKSKPKHENYYPAGGLPSDAMLVVKTSALRDFETSLEFDQLPDTKPLSTKERDSLIRIIYGMAVDGYGFDPTSAKSPVPIEITEVVSRITGSIDAGTVRKYLKEGRENFGKTAKNG